MWFEDLGIDCKKGDTTVEHFKVVNVAPAVAERGHQGKLLLWSCFMFHHRQSEAF